MIEITPDVSRWVLFEKKREKLKRRAFRAVVFYQHVAIANGESQRTRRGRLSAQIHRGFWKLSKKAKHYSHRFYGSFPFYAKRRATSYQNRLLLAYLNFMHFHWECHLWLDTAEYLLCLLANTNIFLQVVTVLQNVASGEG